MVNPIPQTAKIPDSDYIIIGGTGDLSLRKIFPALFWRYLNGQITQNFRLIVVARNVMAVEEFAVQLRPYCAQAFNDREADEGKWTDFIALIQIVKLDVDSGKGIDFLAKLLRQGFNKKRPCIFYLATAPSLFGKTCLLLGRAGYDAPQCRIVIEKPLGHDVSSAEKINNELLSVFSERQIYRIDHYLGKETVQNLMALRFANVIFESQWNNHHIDHVQITVAETVGVGQRKGYYDANGAIRDMLQNHLLQLLCLVAMEPPAQFNADQVRDEKLRVLRALRPFKEGEMIKGQYQEYENELGSPSHTETYVAMKLSIDNWRWAGIPFYIRTGKKLAIHASEIIITFKSRPHDIFSKPSDNPPKDYPNRLIIRVQPQEGLRFQLVSKEPGPGGMRLFPSELNLSFGETFNQRLPDAYERLLMDIARGNQTLFMRLDEVLAAWQFIDPIIATTKNSLPLLYRSGTMGPIDTLLKAEGREWIDPVRVST